MSLAASHTWSCLASLCLNGQLALLVASTLADLVAAAVATILIASNQAPEPEHTVKVGRQSYFFIN